MACHHATSRAQHGHLAVTCNVTVANVKTIVIVMYLAYMRSHKINPKVLWYKGIVKMTQIAYFGSFWVQFRVSRDVPISLQGKPRFELSYRSNLQQPVEFKIVSTGK